MVLKRVEFTVLLVILTVLCGYGPGCLNFHSSIEYFDNSTWYMVLEGLKFTDLLFIFDSFLHGYGPGMLGISQIYCSSIVTLI